MKTAGADAGTAAGLASARPAIRVVARIRTDHPAFAGHFPGQPILPGVVLLAEVLDAVERTTGTPLGSLTIRSAKFHAPVIPVTPVTPVTPACTAEDIPAVATSDPVLELEIDLTFDEPDRDGGRGIAFSVGHAGRRVASGGVLIDGNAPAPR